MKHSTAYFPKSGDKVSASAHDGEFIVHSVDSNRRTVDVRLVGPANAVNYIAIPWETLKLLKPSSAKM
jgi:hypothetical protein